jgi:hypothetical protein
MTTTVNLAKDSADQRLRAHLAELARVDFERTQLAEAPRHLNAHIPARLSSAPWRPLVATAAPR